MSAPSKTNTPAPSTGKHDWACATMDKLKSGLDDEPEIYDVKVGERKRHQQAKKEAKEKEARECQQREEVEHWAREEAARLEREAAAVWRQEEADHQVQEERWAKEEKERLEREAAVRQEAAIKKAMETAEKRAQEDTEEKCAEALKKIWAAEETVRQRVEAEASRQKSVTTKKQVRRRTRWPGPSGMPGPGLRCVRCARTGAECKWDPENKCQHACMQCARHKEKCEWPEVVGSVSRSGSGDVKGKGKAVATLPRASEKKKLVKKSATKVIDSDVEIVVKPSDVSGSGSGHALLQRMDRLILAVENLAEAQWYMVSACAASGMVVGTLVNECNFLRFEGVGLGEENEEEEMDTEAVDQEAVEQEVTELRKEILEPRPSDDEM
ncbi:hypothetical protein SCLCIDRAFT_20971 [Scleroderma citrinum Foug A]|uniref:Zn(2)-C6 fungal-type domain-containing protein n=1 Tax=Scleroderma citrinum Foug A TaxID=1036808 RepID=A0A0C3EGL8_9AGAM|nr:hypothetical protein SCLCIDRAFT_20971 [Scleroderma citrinum Foug A]